MLSRPRALSVGHWLRLAACGAALGGGSGLRAAAPSPSELGRPVVRNYPPGEHLRGASSRTMTQDAAGNIYFANANGMLIYDGATWTFRSLTPEAAGVRKLAVAADGTIYLGGASVLGYLHGVGKDAKFVSLADQLPPEHRDFDEIESVAASGDAVCFSDEQKILVWRNGRFTAIPYPTPAYSHGARFHRVGDTLLVTALGHPLRRLAGDRLEVVADDPVLRENQIATIVPGTGPGAHVLLTAERGFFQLDAHGVVAPLPVEANRWLAGKRIFRALQVADGSWAVTFSAASGDYGMRFSAAGAYIGPLDLTMGIHSRGLRDLFRDREGGLWIGMEAGATRLEWPSAISLFDSINGLGHGAVADVARHEGTLYAATAEGVFRLAPLDDTGRGARFERALNGSMTALLSHPGGLLALGNARLFVSTGAGFQPVARVPAGDGGLYRSKRDPARVWIATMRGVRQVRHTPSGWRDEGAVPGFNENCRALCEAPDGALWVATHDRGLFRLEFSATGDTAPGAPRVERFAGGDGLPASFARTNVVEWAGAPLFSVENVPRLFRYDVARRRFEPLPGALPPAAAGEGWTLSEGATGNADGLWLADSTAIHRQPLDGAPPQRLPHLALARAGAVAHLREEAGPNGHVLWICGADALVRVEMAGAFAASAPFNTLLDGAAVREGAQLEPEHAPLTFRFQAPRYRPASAVVYQTRLAGYESAWSPWDAKRERFFARLPAGDYRFEVRARDADGALAAPAALAFTVLAPWWRTPWAWLGYVATGAGLVTGLVRLRTRALHQRAEHLAGVVADRTAELAQKNRELTRLHQLEFDEKVAARLAEEKSRLEVLRYQLNPHFLFNTLASISASLPPGRGTAHAMVERLADFCRLTLYRADDSEWTTLGAEMKLLRAYLAIEQSRWTDLLDVEIDCDATLDDERLPYFLLLPLVENALKYGRATSPDRVGFRLAVRRDADRGGLLVEIANTGDWLEPTARKSVSSLGIGLDNLRERLGRYYPRAHQLSFSHADGWVTVELRLFVTAGDPAPTTAAPVL